MYLKKLMSILLITIIIFAACSNQEEGILTRVDADQKIENEENYEEVSMITDKKSIELLDQAFEDIKWSSKTKVKVNRKADVKVTLFIEFDKNMPERLREYEIWFIESSGTAEIVNNNENEGYGELDKDNTKILRENLLK